MARWKRAVRRSVSATVRHATATVERVAWRAHVAWHRLRNRHGPAATLGIAAIVKNEGPYLLEWIAWHRCLGITDFFIADNASTDGSTALLAALHRAGFVTHIPFPGQPGVPPQLPAYTLIAEQHGAAVDWLAFIDADEFIRPLNRPDHGEGAVQAFLGRLPPRVGAVAMHWAVYGSSGREVPGGGPVTERFTRRAPRDFAPNLHIKSIVRCRDWAGPLPTPHGFALRRRRCYIDTASSPVDPHDAVRGFTDRPVWGEFRLNHYAVKSRWEFIHKKVSRGRADALDPRHARTDAYFTAYDANTVVDLPEPVLLKRLHAETQHLRHALHDIPPEDRDLDLALE